MAAMKSCPPEEVALKSFFLGPQAENSDWLLREVVDLFERWFEWRRSLFPADGRALSDLDVQTPAFRRRREDFSRRLHELAERLEGEVPKFSPRYIGHMISETSLPAFLGHLAVLLHNPNAISDEVAQVASTLEDEAVAGLLTMVGYDPRRGRGHFTSGGTLANFEALWRARYRLDHWLALGAFVAEKSGTPASAFEAGHIGWERFRRGLARSRATDGQLRERSFVANSPWEACLRYERVFGTRFEGPVVLVPGNKHYSWLKGVSLLGLGNRAFWPVKLDRSGTMDVRDLRRQIERARAARRPVLMVVSVAGTTELGEMDPVHEVQDLLDDYRRRDGLHFWHHVDAAYGGFFCSMLGPQRPRELSPRAWKVLGALGRANSITLDPHKLGYVPYACGAILVRDEENYLASTFSAPYLAVGNQRWLRTLEGSRPASGAVATWLTARCVGLDPSGYGTILRRTLRARETLCRRLAAEVPGFRAVPADDSNILCFTLARAGEPLSAANRRIRRVYAALGRRRRIFVSRTVLGAESYGALIGRVVSGWKGRVDADRMSLVRMVLMNPFFTSKEMAVDFPGLVAEELRRAGR
jgi:glutamate/tyrosine decarboxylase-like PLP-dependent enzyme